jgi:glycosyltransferase involved in cell wall biosynthesis
MSTTYSDRSAVQPSLSWHHKKKFYNTVTLDGQKAIHKCVDLVFHEIPRVSVIIPAKNEAPNLPYVLPKIPCWVDEVILVDGHSGDGTVDVARLLMPEIRIITQEGRGKGAALRTGFAAATGDILIMLDADGSTNPQEIPVFVGALLGGADFVKGSRFLQGGGTADMDLIRRLGNHIFVMFTNLIFGSHYSDLCFGYNALWCWVLPRLNLHSAGFEIETEMNLQALRANLHVVEVPSYESRRIFGKSNLNTFRDGWRVLLTIIKHRLQLPKPQLPVLVSDSE